LTERCPRIVIVSSRLDVGGTERHIARILPALQRRGLDIALYVMERGGPLEADIAAQGVRVEGSAPGGVLHWPRATLALARWLRRERPDVVHFFLPRPYVFGSLAAELAGQRLRLMSRRSLTVYRDKYPLLGGIERWLHRRTFGLLGNSQAVMDQLAAEVDDTGKLALIHNGIDLPSPVFTSRRRQTRDLLQIPDGALVTAVIANLIAYKGHRDLIAALALIKDQLPQPWRLLAIGRDDGIGADLKAQAQSLAIDDNILWLGERGDVDELLSASDMFTLPSHQEGFPMRCWRRWLRGCRWSRQRSAATAMPSSKTKPDRWCRCAIRVLWQQQSCGWRGILICARASARRGDAASNSAFRFKPASIVMSGFTVRLARPIRRRSASFWRTMRRAAASPLSPQRHLPPEHARYRQQ